MVYLSGVPGNMITNYKLYHAGLHARLEWRREGHSTYTMEVLTQLGRRLADPGFVCFLTLFEDILCRMLRPYACLVEGVVEPWVGVTAGRRLLVVLEEARDHLSYIRKVVKVASLASPGVREHLGRALSSGRAVLHEGVVEN